MYTAAVHDIPWATAPVSPVITGRSPDQHHETSTVMEYIREQIPKIWDYHEEIKYISQISDQHPPKNSGNDIPD